MTTLRASAPAGSDRPPAERPLPAVVMVQAAAADAIAGDPEAVRWLRLCGLRWLELVCDQADPAAVLAAVLRRCDP